MQQHTTQHNQHNTTQHNTIQHNTKQDEQKLLEARPGRHEPILIPNLIELTENYRSHNGILSVAAEVIDILKDTFPQSFDHLPRERGFFNGPKPKLLISSNAEDAIVMIAGRDKKPSQIE
jgi:hypothetical protein